MSDPNWYQIENVADLPSPSLLVYPDRVAANIRRMVEIAGGDPTRLRPHVKTHKMAEVVKMQLDAGINRFKCATIAEMEMTAGAGAGDVLFAFQPVGPNVDRLRQLQEKFPDTAFSALVDDAENLERISDAGFGLRLFVDVDCGMHRTGIGVEDAFELCEAIEAAPGVEFMGLHIYDGHNHAPDPGEREGQFDAAIQPVRSCWSDWRPREFTAGKTSGEDRPPLHCMPARHRGVAARGRPVSGTRTTGPSSRTSDS